MKVRIKRRWDPFTLSLDKWIEVDEDVCGN